MNTRILKTSDTVAVVGDVGVVAGLGTRGDGDGPAPTTTAGLLPVGDVGDGARIEEEGEGAGLTLQTMSVVLVQTVSIPAAPQVESAAHVAHGALPVADHVAPTAHATWHTVSVDLVHAVFTCVHVESAAHVPHGALPVAEKVEPTTQATWHTVSVVVVHAVSTP